MNLQDIYKATEYLMESYAGLEDTEQRKIVLVSTKKILEQIHELILKGIKAE